MQPSFFRHKQPKASAVKALSADSPRHIHFATMKTGGGHIATARAMQQAIEASHPQQYQMVITDFLDEVGATLLDRTNKEIWYSALRNPIIARWGQHLIDFWPQFSIHAQRLILDSFARHAIRYFQENPSDLIVSNHALASSGLGYAKKVYGLDIPVLSFITETHNAYAFWADPWVDHIIAPNEGIKSRFAGFRIPNEQMSIAGYPVQQAFLHASPKAQARQTLGLDKGFSCLLSLGGEGFAKSSVQMLETLLAIDELEHVIVICGRNASLKRKLERSLHSSRLRVEGFVNNMADFVAASDIVVGKAGPASVYETLAVGRPMLITGYAGINERGVIDFVTEQKVGHYLPEAQALSQSIRDYAHNPEKLEQVAQRCHALKLAEQTQYLADTIVDAAHYPARYMAPQRRRRKSKRLIDIVAKFFG